VPQLAPLTEAQKQKMADKIIEKIQLLKKTRDDDRELLFSYVNLLNNYLNKKGASREEIFLLLIRAEKSNTDRMKFFGFTRGVVQSHTYIGDYYYLIHNNDFSNKQKGIILKEKYLRKACQNWKIASELAKKMNSKNLKADKRLLSYCKK
jgi:hypothetical protein